MIHDRFVTTIITYDSRYWSKLSKTILWYQWNAYIKVLHFLDAPSAEKPWLDFRREVMAAVCLKNWRWDQQFPWIHINPRELGTIWRQQSGGPISRHPQYTIHPSTQLFQHNPNTRKRTPPPGRALASSKPFQLSRSSRASCLKNWRMMGFSVVIYRWKVKKMHYINKSSVRFSI